MNLFATLLVNFISNQHLVSCSKCSLYDMITARESVSRNQTMVISIKIEALNRGENTSRDRENTITSLYNNVVYSAGIETKRKTRDRARSCYFRVQSRFYMPNAEREKKREKRTPVVNTDASNGFTAGNIFCPM